MKKVSISADSDLHLNIDELKEYYDCLFSIEELLSILTQNIVIVNLLECDEKCEKEFSQFEEGLYKKKQEMNHSILAIAFQFYQTILDHCIQTSSFTLDDESSYSSQAVHQTITQGNEKIGFWFMDLKKAFVKQSFSHGLLVKLCNMIDKEVKERVLYIHYNKVW